MQGNMTNRNRNPELLSPFWDLAEGDDVVRVAACKKIVELLKSKQTEDEELCEELEYTLKRLIRGLSSPRKWARLGYATALTQALRQFPVVTTAYVVKQVEGLLKPNKADLKGEASCIWLAQVLVGFCILESGAIERVEKGDAALILGWFLDSVKAKMPLHHVCFEGMAQLISKVSSELFVEELFPSLEDILTQGWEQRSPDALLLLLTTMKYHSSVVNKEFLVKHWNCKRILCGNNWSILADTILKSCSDHPIQHLVCRRLVENAAQDSDLLPFWNNVIEERVLVKPGQKKYLVFQLVPVALKLCKTIENIRVILSPALIQVIIKNLSFPDHLLHGAAKHLVCALVKYVEECKDGHCQVEVMTRLLSPPSSVKDMGLAKLRTISLMENALVSEGAVKWSEILMDVVLVRHTSSLLPVEVEDNSQALDVIRGWAVNQLTGLLNLECMEGNHQWHLTILSFVFVHSHFTLISGVTAPSGQVLKTSEVEINKVLRGNLNAAFSRCLHKLETLKTGKNSGRSNSAYISHVHAVMKLAEYLMTQNKAAKPGFTVSPKTKKCWDKAFGIVQKLHSKKTAQTVEEMAFELLFMQLSLQLFSEPVTATDLLQDVHICYEKALVKKKRSSLQKSDIEEEASWVEVLTEVLLSMLSEQSAVTRKIVSTVFGMLCSHINYAALQQILDVILPKESTGDEEDVMTFEESEEEDEEEEMEDANGNEENGNDSEDDSEDESDDSEEEEEELYSDLTELRARLKNEMGKAALPSEEEAEVDSDASEDFDDETMMRLDDKISAAFKSMRKDKKASKEQQLQLMHFKIRCLDLLKHFVQKSPQVGLASKLVIPLLKVMDITSRTSIQNELFRSAEQVFKELCKVKKFSGELDDEQSQEIQQVFSNLVEMSPTVFGTPMVNHVSSGCLAVIKMATGGEKLTGSHLVGGAEKGKSTKRQQKVLDHSIKSLSDVLKDFCLWRDNKLNPVFLSIMCERQPAIMWSLTKNMLDFLTNADVRVYCRTQMCTMLCNLINKATQQIIEPEAWNKFRVHIARCLLQTVKQFVSRNEYKPFFVRGVLLLFNRMLMTDTKFKDHISENCINHLKTILSDVKLENVVLTRKILKSVGVVLEPMEKSKKQKRKRTVSTDSATEVMDVDVAPVPKKKGKKVKLSNGHAPEEDEVEDMNVDDHVPEKMTEVKTKKHNKKDKLKNNKTTSESSEPSSGETQKTNKHKKKKIKT